MQKLHMKSLVIILFHAVVVFSVNPEFRKQQSKTGPSCNPSDAAKNAANWNRCPLGQDYNAWYGLTNEALDYYDAAKQCESFGAKLVSASDATVDLCAAYAIDVNEAFDQLVLYSGRYLYGVSSWVWCTGDKCDSSFDYVNWDNSSSSEGNCMGGYLQDYEKSGSFESVSGYGWVERDCKELLVRSLCRLDCDSEEPVTTEQATTEQVTTFETTTSAITTQYLMYTMRNSRTMYSYKLDVDQDPVKNGQYTIPFSTSFPGLVFNVQLNSLEVIGDWFSGSNKNHQMMSIDGSFSDATSALFNGDSDFQVCYSPSAGTLVFSYSDHSGGTQVYIITQNSNWNTIESSDKYLNSFQIPNSYTDYYGFGVVDQEDKIYLIGGYTNGYQNTVQMLNLQDVNSLQEAQTRQWIFMANLKTPVRDPAVVYSNDQLLVVGDTGSSDTCQDVQYLNLASNTTGVYAGSIDCGGYSGGFQYPGMYNIVGGTVSIFGGYSASESCIQQTASGNDLDTWVCLSGSESALEGLGYYSHGSSIQIRFSNFVV